MKRKIFTQIKFLLGFGIIIMASDVWASEPSFRCYASYQGQQIQLAYASPSETYLASGNIGGFQIEAMDNETSSYQIEVTDGQSELVSSATLPYYDDARLQIGHRGDRLTVQCLK